MIMKQIFLNIIWAVALLTLAAACEKTPQGGESGEGGDDNTPKEFVWHFSVQNASQAQSLGLFIRDFEGGLTNGEIRLDATSGASFEIKTDYPLTTGGKVYAYAPYNADSNDHKAIKMSVSEEQTAGEPVMPRASVPLVFADPKPDSTITIQMLDLASTISLKVYSTKDTGEKITSVSFTSETPLAGAFSFNIKGIDANQEATLAIGGYEAKTVKVSTDITVGTNADVAQAIPVVVAPGSYTGIITVVTDKDQYGIVVEDPVVLARAAVVPLTVRIAPRVSQDESGSTEDFAGGELVTE